MPSKRTISRPSNTDDEFFIQHRRPSPNPNPNPNPPTMASPSKSPRKRNADPNHRTWTDADTCFFLRAAADFRDRTGSTPTGSTMAAFFDTVKDSIPPDVTVDQLGNKYRNFKRKYSKMAAAGGDDSQIFKLADELWGEGKKEKDTKDEIVRVADEVVAEGSSEVKKKKKKGDSVMTEVENEMKKKKTGDEKVGEVSSKGKKKSKAEKTGDENVVVGSEKVGEGSTIGKKNSKADKTGDENAVVDGSTIGKKNSKAGPQKIEDGVDGGEGGEGKKRKKSGKEKVVFENGAVGNEEVDGVKTEGKKRKKAGSASETTDEGGSRGKEGRKKAESAVVTMVEAVEEEKGAGSEDTDDTEEEDAGIEEEMDVDGSEGNGGAGDSVVSCPVYKHYIRNYFRGMSISEELFEVGLKVSDPEKVKAYERKWRKHHEANLKLHATKCDINKEIYTELILMFK